MSIKKYAIIFISAFMLNLAWENLHARLYTNYKGGQITEWVLLHATFFDAVIITVICVVAALLSRKVRLWFIGGSGLLVAVLMERFALMTARWAYQPAMPIVPLLRTGLTPTIQLAILGIFASMLGDLVISNKERRKI